MVSLESFIYTGPLGKPGGIFFTMEYVAPQNDFLRILLPWNVNRYIKENGNAAK